MNTVYLFRLESKNGLLFVVSTLTAHSSRAIGKFAIKTHGIVSHPGRFTNRNQYMTGTFVNIKKDYSQTFFKNG